MPSCSDLLMVLSHSLFVYQLKRYFEPEQDLLPPLKLESCISAHGDQVFIQEPLVLMRCLNLIDTVYDALDHIRIFS